MKDAYVLVAGSRKRPTGYIGTYRTKAEAQAHRPGYACYIARERVSDNYWTDPVQKGSTK